MPISQSQSEFESPAQMTTVTLTQTRILQFVDSNVIQDATSILSQSFLFSKASDIIWTYPSFYSAYLFGSYAKDIASPSSDIDIVVFTHKFNFEHIGGAHMNLEEALGKKVDLLVSPREDFVKKIQQYWIPIPLWWMVSVPCIWMMCSNCM